MLVRAHDKRIACEEEFSDSEDEGEGGRRNAASFKKAKRAKTEGEKEGEEKEKKGEEETKGIYSFFFSFSSHPTRHFVKISFICNFYELTFNLSRAGFKKKKRFSNSNLHLNDPITIPKIYLLIYAFY